MTSSCGSFGHLTLLPPNFTIILGSLFKPFSSYATCFTFLRPLPPFFITIPPTWSTPLVGYHLSIGRVTFSLPSTLLHIRILRRNFSNFLLSPRVRSFSLMKTTGPSFFYIGPTPPLGSNNGLVRPLTLRSWRFMPCLTVSLKGSLSESY